MRFWGQCTSWEKQLQSKFQCDVHPCLGSCCCEGMVMMSWRLLRIPLHSFLYSRHLCGHIHEHTILKACICENFRLWGKRMCIASPSHPKFVDVLACLLFFRLKSATTCCSSAFGRRCMQGAMRLQTRCFLARQVQAIPWKRGGIGKQLRLKRKGVHETVSANRARGQQSFVLGVPNY